MTFPKKKAFAKIPDGGGVVGRREGEQIAPGTCLYSTINTYSYQNPLILQIHIPNREFIGQRHLCDKIKKQMRIKFAMNSDRNRE